MWRPQADSNRRPSDYKSAALPLSYGAGWCSLRHGLRRELEETYEGDKTPVEPVTGIEPAALCLGSRCSAIELHRQICPGLRMRRSPRTSRFRADTRTRNRRYFSGKNPSAAWRVGLDSNQLPPGVLPGVLPEALPTHVPSYRTINGAGLLSCSRRRKKEKKNVGWGAADYAQRPRGGNPLQWKRDNQLKAASRPVVIIGGHKSFADAIRDIPDRASVESCPAMLAFDYNLHLCAGDRLELIQKVKDSRLFIHSHHPIQDPFQGCLGQL